MMNSLSRSILNLYTYDAKADDTSIPNVLRQCLNLISQFPMLMVYGYHAYNYRMGDDLFIYAPSPELSTAENILMMLREDRKYTKLEAKILDMASCFTWIMAAVITPRLPPMSSLHPAPIHIPPSPRHGDPLRGQSTGGANIKVTQMFEDMKGKSF